MKHCKNCTQPFEIFPEDRAFYASMEVPEPTLCPDCRQQRRSAQPNQLFLSKRKCDLTGQTLVSNFSPESPYPVYAPEVWYSDAWDPLQYGRDYDFGRPFFEQFADLFAVVPRPALFTGYQYDENSPYTNHAGKNKNCYFIFDSDENWDCLYSYSINHCKNVMDCYRTRKCELCYECVDSYSCYHHCAFLQDCENCTDSFFLKNCIGCKNCLFSVNLRNKQYYIHNQKASKEEYEAYLQKLSSWSELQQLRSDFQKFQIQFPQKYLHGTHNENVRGEYLDHCKNAQLCFDSSTLWDCRYVVQGFMPLKDCMDVSECGEAERLYECVVCGYELNTVKFAAHTLGACHDAEYIMYCPHTAYLFGCIGLRHKQYCILNKQYTQEEYEELLPRIKAHMRETGEYGEFFPIALSSFGYNQTVAQEYFPLTKEQAIAKGYKWADEKPPDFRDVTKKIPANRLPDTIADIPDDIVNWAIACESSGKLFRIQKPELQFYRQMNLPNPHEKFLVRHKRRQSLRNPRQLWSRKCDSCEQPIETSYAPERPEKVYCEACYLQAVI